MSLVVTALMDSVFYDKTPAYEGEECQVKIDGNSICVSYEDDDGYVLYKGTDKGHGHYELTCQERQGRASLHQFKNSKILEGFWVEGGCKGFWRITLPQ